jgi:hypothetical protein
VGLTCGRGLLSAALKVGPHAPQRAAHWRQCWRIPCCTSAGKSFWIRGQSEALIFTTTAVPRASLLYAFCPSDHCEVSLDFMAHRGTEVQRSCWNPWSWQCQPQIIPIRQCSTCCTCSWPSAHVSDILVYHPTCQIRRVTASQR